MSSGADSFFSAREPLQLPIELFDGYQGNESAMVVAMPGTLPGPTFNQAPLIVSVSQGKAAMVVVNFAYGIPSKPFIQTILPAA